MSTTTETRDRVVGLHANHLSELRASGLSDETIRDARIYSESNYGRIKTLLNRRQFPKSQAPVMVFPFLDRDGNIPYSRVKPDRPRKVGERLVKYESPVGSPNHVYVPPSVWHLLDDPSRELLITEGEKKCLKSTQDGFPCIGLVGVYGWKDKNNEKILPALERVDWSGRVVYIVFDSDVVTNEQVQDAERRLAAHLARRGARVRVVRLPSTSDGRKQGLDDFLVAHSIAEFRQLLDKATEADPLTPMESREAANQADPASEAAAFLESETVDDIPTLRFWRGSFHVWQNGKYIDVGTAEARARVIQFLNRRLSFVTSRVTSDILDQVRAQSHLASRLEAPCWLGQNPVETWEPRELLVTRNAIVNLRTLETLPPTPRLFTPAALDFDYNENAPRPDAWLTFLSTLFGDDCESIQTLRDWFGYCLTPDTRRQKILMVIGPRRSGKGTIGRILRTLVGESNAAGPTLASLGTNFGLSALLGKTVAIVSDARLSGKTDTAVVTERLLSISGEDALTIDRKHQEPITTRLLTRFVILSNELPSLHDSSSALAGRMLLLRLTQSFYGDEDLELESKLHAERASILLWAMAGWQRLQNRGKFIAPKTGLDLLEDLEELASPVTAFVREKCEINPAWSVPVEVLFDAYVAWCVANGRKPSTRQVFGRDLKAAFPQLGQARPRDDNDNRRRAYEGIRLGD